MIRFLDTNVLIRYFTGDHPDKAARVLALLERVEAGEEKLLTSPLVVFETVFTLQKFYDVPRDQIRDILVPILLLAGLKLEGEPDFLRAFDLYVATSISFADAYNAAYLQARGLSEIYTWDRDFDQIDGVTRLEP